MTTENAREYLGLLRAALRGGRRPSARLAEDVLATWASARAEIRREGEVVVLHDGVTYRVGVDPARVGVTGPAGADLARQAMARQEELTAVRARMLRYEETLHRIAEFKEGGPETWSPVRVAREALKARDEYVTSVWPSSPDAAKAHHAATLEAVLEFVVERAQTIEQARNVARENLAASRRDAVGSDLDAARHALSELMRRTGDAKLKTANDLLNEAADAMTSVGYAFGTGVGVKPHLVTWLSEWVDRVAKATGTKRWPVVEATAGGAKPAAASERTVAEADRG